MHWPRSTDRWDPFRPIVSVRFINFSVISLSSSVNSRRIPDSFSIVGSINIPTENFNIISLNQLITSWKLKTKSLPAREESYSKEILLHYSKIRRNIRHSSVLYIQHSLTWLASSYKQGGFKLVNIKNFMGRSTSDYLYQLKIKIFLTVVVP